MQGVSFITLVPAVILLLFGFYKLYGILAIRRKINTSQTWPQTSALVTSAVIQSSYTRNNGRRYFAMVNYAYQVMGTEYQGKFRRDSLWGTEGKAKQAAAETPAGSNITLRYNPEKPNVNVTPNDKVRGGDIASTVLLILFGAAVGVVMVIL